PPESCGIGGRRGTAGSRGHSPHLPFPSRPDTRPALNRRHAFVKRSAQARESQKTEKGDMTDQDQKEEPGQTHNSLTPLNDTRREPIAGQKRKLCEARFNE